MTDSREFLEKSVPLIRRARAYRLYTGDGRRFVDCWQDGGAAILGHRAGGFRQAFMNKASRGLLLRLPGPEHDKLEKAMRSLWAVWTTDRAHCDARPDGVRPLLFFRNQERLRMNLERVVGTLPRCDALTCGLNDGSDCRSGAGSAQGARLLTARPFAPVCAEDIDWIVPVLPVPRALSPAVLIGPQIRTPGTERHVGQIIENAPASVRNSADYVHGKVSLPNDEYIPGALLAAATRAVYDLISMQREGEHPQSELAYKLSEIGVWNAVGPWLVPVAGKDPERYRQLFTVYREHGVIINPDPGAASVVPADLSRGEREQLLRATARAQDQGLSR